MNPADPAGILVVRLGAMGDIVHALPAVSTLKHSFPRARLTWAVEPRWAVLLRDNPFVDEVLEVDPRRGWLGAWRKLRATRCELAVDFQGLLKSALVASAARPERLVGFHWRAAREKAAALFYSHGVRPSAAHVVDRNLELSVAAGATRRRIDFPLPECAPEGDLPDGDFVLASPCAGWRAKQWPASHYARLAELLDPVPLVINCAPAERAEAEAIAAQVRRGRPRLNVSSIAGLLGVTRRARAVVGVDSGPLHLAAALGKPGVALFGPTDPARNGPYGESFSVLRTPGAPTTYKRGEEIAASMHAIAPERVFAALEAQISRQPVGERHR